MPTAGLFLEYDVVEAEEKNRGHYVTVAQMFTKKLSQKKKKLLKNCRRKRKIY